MPNHFHLLLFQISKYAIPKLLQQITNAYTQYFNQKYKRVGSLFQGPYKAVRIEKDEVLLHINRYIHLNPISAELTSNLNQYPWSSYRQYIGSNKSKICDTSFVFGNFSSVIKYQEFILDQVDYATSLEQIKHFTLE